MSYADDLLILVSGTFPSVMSDIMEQVLGKVNPTKTELMLFTTKGRVPEFHLPRLDERILGLPSYGRHSGS